MPTTLRSYLVAVAVGGPALALVVAAQGVGGMTGSLWLAAGLLLLFAAVAYGNTLEVGQGYHFDVSEVAWVAMVILFPPALPGVLAVMAASWRVARRPSEAFGELFNLGQTSFYVTSGALCLAATRDLRWLGPSLEGLPPVGAIVLTAAAMYVVNAGLVAGAISLQTGSHLGRLWRGELAVVAGPDVVLAALGVVVALVARDYPLAMPLLVMPAALAHYSARRANQLRAETRDALAALVDIVELRDPYTAGHSLRVAELARTLALRLGLTAEEAELIESAGRVHDIGKVAISPTVLHKYGPLDDSEWGEMRQHPVHGTEVIGRFAACRDVARLVRHHHERWDGSGYPDGLARERIPLGARILAVADAFDAMTSTRSYRPAKGVEAVLRELADGAGRQWDPTVVEAMVASRREAAVGFESPAGERPLPA